MTYRDIGLEDGKYTVVRNGGQLSALRHGEPWQDLTGNKLIGALCARIDELEDAAHMSSALMREAAGLLESLPIETLEASPLYRWPLCDELGGAALILEDAVK